MGALKMLLAASCTGAGKYCFHFIAPWACIQRCLIDQRLGGLFRQVQDAGLPWHYRPDCLISADKAQCKGDIREDASHDGRALPCCRQHVADVPEPPGESGTDPKSLSSANAEVGRVCRQ